MLFMLSVSLAIVSGFSIQFGGVRAAAIVKFFIDGS
jgi:hypothetical protein